MRIGVYIYIDVDVEVEVIGATNALKYELDKEGIECVIFLELHCC